MSHLILVGFMGSGKSTVGRRLASRLNLPFVDTDHRIEGEIGMPIRDYFARHGEEAFRDVESRVLEEVLSEPDSVVSTGGGVLTRPRNVETLRRNGVLIHLAVDAETVLKRTGNRKDRPLLAGAEDPLARIRELMAARESLYAQADVRVETTGRTLDEVAEAVLEAWLRHRAPEGEESLR